MAAHEPSHRGNVVVTGASTGIGAACVARLHYGGFQVFAGVRKSEDGERLQRQVSDIVAPVHIEVEDEQSIQAAAAFVADRVGEAGLWGLVNNAGIVVSAPLEFIPLADFRRQMEVNLVGHLAVTQALLPLIRKARGRVVNMSSLAARVTTPFGGPYSASKSALEAVNDALRMELGPWGIDVVCIEPGNVATPIWMRSKTEAENIHETLPHEAQALYGERHATFGETALKTGQHGMPPERVAKTVVHALEARTPRTRYVVGMDARFVVLLSRILPARWMDALTVKAMGL